MVESSGSINITNDINISYITTVSGPNLESRFLLLNIVHKTSARNCSLIL